MSFRELTPADVVDGTDEAISEARAVLDELIAPKDQRTFENTMRPLDRISDIMGNAFYRYAFMGYVHTDKEVRDAAKESEEKLSKFGVEMIFRDDLNTAVKEYAATEEAQALEGEKARFLEFALRDLRRAGHDLDAATRGEVKAKTERLVELSVRFQQNIDEWEAFILVDRDGLDGLPDSYIDGLDRDEETGLYKVTIDYPRQNAAKAGSCP